VRRGHPWPALAIGFAWLLPIAALAPHRHWDPDEFEHAQAAWLVAEGLVPFADFFEHHTPLWYLLAAPFAAWADPVVYDRAIIFLVGARFASLALSLGVMAATWALARRLVGHHAATVAVALLAGSFFFILKGIEVRPDPLATLALVTSVWAMAHAMAERRAMVWAALAGACYGIALLASQKAICAAPGLAVGCLWLALRGGGARRALQLAAAAVAGAALVAMPVIAWFAAHGALGPLFDLTVTANLAWTRAMQDRVWLLADRMLRQDPALVALAGIGSVLLAGRRRRPAATLLVLPPLLSLAAGAVALPVVQEQYFVLALPFAAIAGGAAAAWLYRRLPPGIPRRVAVAGIALLMLATTARNLHDAFRHDDTATRAKLAHLLEMAPQDGTVMGGWSTGIAFRRPAWFYFFLHAEVQAHIPPQAYDALVAGLRAGTIRPAIIDLDAAMTTLPAPVLAEIRRLYVPVEVSTLRRRRDVSGE